MSGEIRVQAIRANLRAEAQVATTAILDVARRLGHPIGEETARLFAVTALHACASRKLSLLEEGIQIDTYPPEDHNPRRTPR